MKKTTSILSLLLVMILIFTTSASAKTTTVKMKYDSPEKDSHAFISGFYQQPKDSLDVVLLGSSAMYRYYMPPQSWKKHGFTSYLFGSACQSFDATELIMKEVSKTQSPDLYVVEIRSLVRAIRASVYKNNQSWQKGSDRYNTWLVESIKSKSMRKKIAKELFPDTYQTIFKQANTDYKTWQKPKTFLTESHYATYQSIQSGKSACPASGFAVIKNAPDLGTYTETIELPKFAKQQINEVAKYIKKNGINVLFVSTPYKEGVQSKTIENSIAAYLAKKGLDYINTNDIYAEMGIDFNQDFYNSKHTNVLGAKKFTKYLAKYIVTNYNVDTTHNSAITKSWNDAYVDWYEVSKEKTALVKENMKNAKKA